jgi:hypothetical protein
VLEFTRRDDLPASLDRLLATFGDPAYVRQKYLAFGARAVRIGRFDVSADTITVELERELSIDRAQWPRWSRPAVGALSATLTLRHRSAWRRVSPARVVATLAIVPVGLPVQAQGAGTIDEVSPAQTVMALRWRVRSPVPLLGRRIERLFTQQLRAALEADHAFTLRYLAEHARSEGRPSNRGPQAEA